MKNMKKILCLNVAIIMCISMLNIIDSRAAEDLSWTASLGYNKPVTSPGPMYSGSKRTGLVDADITDANEKYFRQNSGAYDSNGWTWAQVDLETAKEVNFFRLLAHRTLTAHTTSNIIAIRIEGSVDGNSFTELVPVTYYNGDGEFPFGVTLGFVAAERMQMRYIKLFYKYDIEYGGTSTISIAEFGIYNVENPYDHITTIITPTTPEPFVLPIKSTIIHPEMTAKIGVPAIITVGSPYPRVVVNNSVIGRMSGDLISPSGNIVYSFPERGICTGIDTRLNIEGSPQEIGTYKIELVLQGRDGNEYRDAFYFTVKDVDSNVGEDGYKYAYLDDNNKMVYLPDYKGNRIPNFSSSGYMGGGVRIPDVPVKIVLEPVEGDDGANIQSAINSLAALPIDENGFRGAILLKKGTYDISGVIRIRASGIVLRGEGQGEDGTILVAKGANNRVFIQVQGENVSNPAESSNIRVVDMYVPVGTYSFTVTDASEFQVGDNIMLKWYANEQFLYQTGMDRLTDIEREIGLVNWKPFNISYHRKITSINGNTITVDVPIVCAVQHEFGGADVFKSHDLGKIQQVGIENLRAISEFDPSVTKTLGSGEVYYADDNHSFDLVVFSQTLNSWMRDVTALHFPNVARISRYVRWVTVQDVTSLAPVSTIEGGFRYTFNINVGATQNLVQRCYAEKGRHTYTVQTQVPGPNVFLDCIADNDYAGSEPHQRWSTASIYDNVTADIQFRNRGTSGTGHGWTGANYVAWNTKGSMWAQTPPTAISWVIGHVGTKRTEHLFEGDEASWDSENKEVMPRSLYLQQLEERLGSQAVENIRKHSINNEIITQNIEVLSADVLADVIVLSVNNSIAYVYNTPENIDDDNSEIVPFIKEDHTMVPLRFIAESLGADVRWDTEQSAVTIKMDSKTVKLVIGESSMEVDGNTNALDAPAMVLNGRTFVPLRAVGEAFGKKLHWDTNEIIFIGDSDETLIKFREVSVIKNVIKLLNSHGTTDIKE